MDKTTTWELKLKEAVIGPLKKLAEFAQAGQEKIKKLDGNLNTLAQHADVVGQRMKQSLGGATEWIGGKATNFKNRFTSAITDIKTNVGGMKQMLANEISNMSPMLGRFAGMLTNPYLLAVAAIIGVGTASMAMNNKMDAGMAKINATAQLTRGELSGLKKELLSIGANGTAPLESIPDAYEKIISQTNDVALSLDVLKVASRGATAAQADLDTVAGALAQTMSIVGNQAKDAQEVMDVMFAAKRLGAGEMNDFAQYLPGLIAAGKNLNINFKDVAGTFSFMTAKGQSAADSAMLIQNAFTALSKSDIQKGMQKELGIKMFNSDGSMKAIDTLFSELNNKLSGFSTQKKINILEAMGLKDAQAKQAFSVLMSDSNKLKESFTAMHAASDFKGMGEMEAAFKAALTPMQQVQIATNQVKAFLVQIGTAIGPSVMKVFTIMYDIISGIVTRIMDFAAGSEFIRDVVGAIGFAFNVVLETVKFVWNVLFSMWDSFFGPLFRGFDKMYSGIKSILHIGSNVKELSPEQQLAAKLQSDKKEKADKEKSIFGEFSKANKSGLADNSISTSDSKGGISGDKSASRNITMNLKVENHFHGEITAKVKREAEKIVDVIVGAGRDSSVLASR